MVHHNFGLGGIETRTAAEARLTYRLGLTSSTAGGTVSGSAGKR